MQAPDVAWDRLTIPQVAQRAADWFGEDAALEQDGRTLGFGALAAEALAASRAFLAAGVQRGDRVAIWAPNLVEWVVAALGLQSAGACLVALSTRWKPREVGDVLRRSRAGVLVTVGAFLGTNYADSLADEALPELRHVVTLRGNSKRGVPWEAFLAAGDAVSEADARARLDAVTPDDLSDMIFTSGTTGRPKGVMTAHGQNLRVFDTWARGVGLRRGDRYLIVNPFSHSFGYKAGWLACLMRGATALPHGVFEVDAVLARIAKDRVTVLPGAPTIYQSILAHPDWREHDLSSLRLAVTGAAAIPVELVRRMRNELGFETVITAYGLTESSGTVSMCLPSDDAETIATTSGRAIPGVEVRCIDASGEEVPRGEPGEIVVRGYNVMRGYLDDPEATAEAIDADGWLHTGDVGVMDERGYLRITDRIKDMYICGGFNCYPAEIESALFEHEDVAQAAVVGVPDERMGEVGLAFLVPVAGARLSPEEVVAWCRERMANYKVPRRIEIVRELPTNATGKVDKVALRQRAAATGE